MRMKEKQTHLVRLYRFSAVDQQTGIESENRQGSPVMAGASHPLVRQDMEHLGPWKECERGWKSSKEVDCELKIFTFCGSSMDEARVLAQRGELSAWGSVIGIQQDEARGRRRRPWQSPPGNLHVSFLLPVPEAPWNDLFSLVVGYAVCSELRSMQVPVEIKWPNDILCHGKKVAGILVEERAGELVVGMGMNLVEAPPAELLRRDHAVEAGILDMPEALGPVSFWAKMMPGIQSTIVEIMERWTVREFLDRVEGVLAWRGRRVLQNDGPDQTEGVLAGLANDGGLVLITDKGEVILYSGGVIPL